MNPKHAITLDATVIIIIIFIYTHLYMSGTCLKKMTGQEACKNHFWVDEQFEVIVYDFDMRYKGCQSGALKGLRWREIK